MNLAPTPFYWTYNRNLVIILLAMHEAFLPNSGMFRKLMCVHVCAQLCPTLRPHKNCSLPGSSIHGVFEARILEWLAISFSKGFSLPRDQPHVFCISCIAGRFYHWEAQKQIRNLSVGTTQEENTSKPNRRSMIKKLKFIWIVLA